MLKTNESNLINHPFIFFLKILCYLEANASDFTRIHCIYIDCTGSFQKGLLKKRFPNVLNSIVYVRAFEELNAAQLLIKPSKFTFLFADSLIYKSLFDTSEFNAAIFWSSKEEELQSHEILKAYASSDLFYHTLRNP